MSVRSRVRLSARPSGSGWRSTTAWITLLLTACLPGTSVPAAASQPALGLPAASSGVCQAIAALPDRSAAERAFANLAHQALHDLAANPGVQRSASARVLEAMQKVEADFSQSPAMPGLTDDLQELLAAADAALQTLGVEVPGCF